MAVRRLPCQILRAFSGETIPPDKHTNLRHAKGQIELSFPNDQELAPYSESLVKPGMGKFIPAFDLRQGDDTRIA